MKFETLVTKNNIFQRYIGFASMELKIGDSTIFSGDRVPIEFARRMREKRPERPKTDADEKLEIVLAHSIVDWVNAKLIDKNEGRVMAMSLFKDIGL